MRKTVLAVLVLAVLVASGWYLAETRLADRVRAWIEADPAVAATDVRPLRDPRRLGLRLSAPAFTDPAGGLALDWAEMSLSPLSPTTAELGLPDRAEITLGGRTSALEWRSPQASLRLSPLNRMAPDRLELAAQQLSLDTAPLAASFAVQARLATLGFAAPLAARAAYGVDMRIDGLRPQTLALLGIDAAMVPDPVSLDGNVLLWLDGTPAPDKAQPLIVGLQTAGLSIGAGPLAIRLVGRVVQGADGRAEGQVAVYARDADRILDMAAEMGLIPMQARLLLRAGLSQLSQVGPDTSLPGPTLPEAATDELRLIVAMRDGQISLGGVPVGPAPRFGP